jgi:uncharacterized membrane protein YgcG
MNRLNRSIVNLALALALASLATLGAAGCIAPAEDEVHTEAPSNPSANGRSRAQGGDVASAAPVLEYTLTGKKPLELHPNAGEMLGPRPEPWMSEGEASGPRPEPWRHPQQSNDSSGSGGSSNGNGNGSSNGGGATPGTSTSSSSGNPNPN